MAVEKIIVPDIGTSDPAEIIEFYVGIGDAINKDDPLVALETNKATVEVPSPVAGVIKSLALVVGDKVVEGQLLAEIEVSAEVTASVEPEPQAKDEPETVTHQPEAPAIKPESRAPEISGSSETVYAGPAVRKQSRELGVDLGLVKGSGIKGRITKEDLQAFVKQKMTTASSGQGIEAVPEVDFSRFGPIRVQELNKIKQLTAQGMLRSWLNVPHVTQFDEADITDLETYRKSLNQSHLAQGVKVNILAFIVKAVVKALQAYPAFNSSLAKDGKSLILKDYFNIGIAVETEQGLLVPVIKDAQAKSLLQIVHEITELADKARKGKLALLDMQGGSFTISSLGAIGGTAFTPIVNAPEVAILGVSRTQTKPVYMQDAFQPRLMLPLSLSYDHRVIDGAEAARFTSLLAELLQEIRHLML